MRRCRTKAEQAYFNTRFEQAISLIKPCVEHIESPQEQQNAYLLLARVYFSTQETTEARETVLRLIRMDEPFTLPAYLPPPFVQFFEQIKEQDMQHFSIAEKLRPAPDYIPPTVWQKIDRHWYWVGGSVIVAGAAAFLIDGDLEPAVFAPPPGPPGGESARE